QRAAGPGRAFPPEKRRAARSHQLDGRYVSGRNPAIRWDDGELRLRPGRTAEEPRGVSASRDGMCVRACGASGAADLAAKITELADAPFPVGAPPPAERARHELTAEHFFDGFHDAGFAGLIAGQTRDRGLKFLSAHHLQHALHRLQLEELLAADEEIVLGH